MSENTRRRLRWVLTAACAVLMTHAWSVHATEPLTKHERVPAKLEAKAVARQVYEKASASVVVVESTGQGGSLQGSGVAILNGCAMASDTKKCMPSSTWVVTNAHVVQSANEVRVIAGGDAVTGEVKYRDKDTDIAFVFADGLVVPKADVSEKIASLSPGDPVYAIGAPRGLERTITEGIVSAVRESPSRKLIQTSAAISPGSSGGGLFDAQGNLIGVTTFKIAGGEGLNFAVSAVDLHGLMTARLAADLARIMSNSGNDERLNDGFVRWLYATRGASGSRMSDEYMEENSRSPENLPGLSTYSRAVVAKYLAENGDVPATTEQSTQPAQPTQPATKVSVLHLLCEFTVTRASETRKLSFTVDLTRKTANGHPAEITDASIRWVGGGGTTIAIDRYTGTARVIGNGGGVVPGICSKSEGRAF